MDSALADILVHIAQSGGPVGAVLILAYMYIRAQHKDLNSVQEKRVADQQAMVAKLLELNDKWNETLNAQIEAAETQKQLLADIKQEQMMKRVSGR